MSQRLAPLLLLLTFASSLIITACASSEARQGVRRARYRRRKRQELSMRTPSGVLVKRPGSKIYHLPI